MLFQYKNLIPDIKVKCIRVFSPFLCRFPDSTEPLPVLPEKAIEIRTSS